MGISTARAGVGRGLRHVLLIAGWLGLGGLGALVTGSTLLPAGEGPEGDVGARVADAGASVDFFERRIRPLLVEHCHECHSAESRRVRGGLRLDSADGWRRGGDSGPALVPGDPDHSRLIQAIRYGDPETAMPPGGRLSPAQVADLETWVRMGAPDPRVGELSGHGQIPEEWGTDHWAYQPVTRPELPPVRQEGWVRRDWDRFILAGLESRGLSPTPSPPWPVLVRRLYLDLTGMIPTEGEWTDALAETGEDAWERLVDRLLASPHFGEHWGRHWLDVVRYGESLTLRGFILPEAWRYRDYVIDAFNLDLPYPDFIREQVAGDLMDPAPATRSSRPPDRVFRAAGQESRETPVDIARRRRVATTFWMLGNLNLEEQDKKQLDMDIVDEQLDVLGKVFLGQTLGCARCHDHKFDPITTRDYYALAGILASCRSVEHDNVSRWLEFDLPLTEEESVLEEMHVTRVARFEEELGQARARLDGLTAQLVLDGDGALPLGALKGVVIDDEQALAVGEWAVSQWTGRYVHKGYRHDQDSGKGGKSLTFLPSLPRPGRYEVRLAYLAAENRARRVPVTILHAEGETTVHVNQRQAPPGGARFLSLGEYRFEAGNQGMVLVSNEGTDGHVIADAVQFLPLDAVLEGPGGEGAGGRAALSRQGEREPAEADSGRGIQQQEREALQARVSALEARLKGLKDAGWKRPRYMSLQDRETPVDLPVHIRGSVHQPGDTVARGFPGWGMATETPGMPADQSGRVQLAEWLTDPVHPLTGRVMVNRVWQWLMGEGLVRTPDNFGTTGEVPTHPELLDHLVGRFLETGGSVKSLVRELVTSATYRQGSRVEPWLADSDPDNRLWGRMLRRRMTAESFRDSILVVSGELDRTRTGSNRKGQPSADYGYLHADLRRSVYAPVFRNAIPEIVQLFDGADPSRVTGQRSRTTAVSQALFLMNHAFIGEQADRVVRRFQGWEGTDEDRLTALFESMLGRGPDPVETRRILSFLRVAGRDAGEDGGTVEALRGDPWAGVVQAILASPDFRSID